MKLVRDECCADGIFGQLQDDNGDMLFATLEHAYQDANGNWEPKLPAGVYTCVRYNSPELGYQDFLVQHVPGHDGIELHVGNYDRDSKGCILLGEDRVGIMVTNSRAAFAKFMNSLDGIQQFTLSVS